MRNSAKFIPSLLCLLLAGGAAQAGESDPMQPPAGFVAPLPGQEAAGMAPGQRLTSILRPRAGRPAAIIDGQLIRLGGRIGEARLLAIAENGVTLAGPEGREFLPLTPNIEKKMQKPAAPVKKTGGRAKETK